jgi:hypothetical protein
MIAEWATGEWIKCRIHDIKRQVAVAITGFTIIRINTLSRISLDKMAVITGSRVFPVQSLITCNGTKDNGEIFERHIGTTKLIA